MKLSENKLIRFMPNHTFHSEKLSKTEQFLQECSGWIRLLDFVKEENSYLKNRLSLVVDQKAEADFLLLAEQFQNQFILKDEFINEITQDVRRQQTILTDTTEKKIPAEEKLNKRQQKLRNEIEFLEKDFSADKNQFNKFISSVLE
jgi:hypothetical protein